jgi:GNAT superfamily N-acetyltransferase
MFGFHSDDSGQENSEKNGKLIYTSPMGKNSRMGSRSSSSSTLMDMTDLDPLTAPDVLDPSQSTIHIYEMDGRKHKRFCQNLSLLCKLFLGTKTVFFDVDEFLFYVLYRESPFSKRNQEFVGYFSKEKKSVERFNLSCIMVLPPFQGHNYGRVLIELSYELSRMAQVREIDDRYPVVQKVHFPKVVAVLILNIGERSCCLS